MDNLLCVVNKHYCVEMITQVMQANTFCASVIQPPENVRPLLENNNVVKWGNQMNTTWCGDDTTPNPSWRIGAIQFAARPYKSLRWLVAML